MTFKFTEDQFNELLELTRKQIPKLNSSNLKWELPSSNDFPGLELSKRHDFESRNPFFIIKFKKPVYLPSKKRIRNLKLSI